LRHAIIGIFTLACWVTPSYGQGDSTDAQRCYRGNADVQLAIHYCTQAIELGKLDSLSLSITYVNRGDLFGSTGDYERALADYNAAVGADSANAQAHVARGRYYRRRGQETLAQVEFDRAIALPILSNDSANGYLNRARAQSLKGDLTAALGALDTAARIQPTYREVYVTRASIHTTRREYEATIADCIQALHLNPVDAAVLSLRGNAYFDLGRLQEARADYDAAIAIEPSVAQHYSTRAWLHRYQGDQDLAIADYTEAIRLEPTHGDRFADRAAAYQAKSDWKSAMVDYDAAVRAEPDRALYRSDRADAFEYVGDYTSALIDRDEAIRLEPADGDWRERRAWTLFFAGRTVDALDAFADAIRTDPQAPGHYRARADALLQLGRFDEASADFDSAIRIQPSRGVNYADRADVFLDRREPLAGLAAIDTAEAADREYVGDGYRGYLLLAGLRLDDAIRAYGRYANRRPNAPAAYYGPGVALMVKGELAAAAADFRHALQLNGWDSETELWLHWCVARLGQDATSETAQAARRFDPRKWPGPAFRFALGQLPLDSMLAAAHDPSAIKTREQEAQAYVFAGESFLAVHRPADAIRMFREVRVRNVPWTWSDIFANGELEALAATIEKH
jgi:tetratricopeptide (TPR) repeat protein